MDAALLELLARGFEQKTYLMVFIGIINFRTIRFLRIDLSIDICAAAFRKRG